MLFNGKGLIRPSKKTNIGIIRFPMRGPPLYHFSVCVPPWRSFILFVFLHTSGTRVLAIGTLVVVEKIHKGGAEFFYYKNLRG